MWVRSEFGVLVNLDQVSEVTLSGGTVEAHISQQTRPLAHRANEAEARKVFELVSQSLADGKIFLNLDKRVGEAGTGTGSVGPSSSSGAASGDAGKAQ